MSIRPRRARPDIDDVITAGTAIREALKIIQASGSQAVGVVIALDRQERGKGERSAVQEVEQDLDLRVTSIITLAELQEFLAGKSGYKGALVRTAALSPRST